MKMKSKLLLLSLIMNISITSVVTILYPSSGGYRSKEGYLFTFAHITDSQFSGSSVIFEKVASWLAQQDNISFVVHTGDIVNSPFDETSWKNAYKYMNQLDKKCRWAVLAGDNDVLYGNRVYLANYEKYFGNNSIDQYFVVGDKLLFILFSWSSSNGRISQELLRWMDEVIQKHEKLYVVICLHPYLFGFPFLDSGRASDADEILSHIDKHENVIMTLSGHIHQNWIRIHINGKRKVWSISTEALKDKGYTRLFDVYEDRIEVHSYSPWANRTYTGTLDRFTIKLNPDSCDADGDLWRDDLDIMPTHPWMPNGLLISVIITVGILAYWIKGQWLVVFRRAKFLLISISTMLPKI